MQPTPRTLQQSFFPFASTAFSSSSLTLSLWSERQLAATQTLIWCPAASLDSRSAWEIWARSSMLIMAHPPLDLRHDRRRRQLGRDLAVQHGGRGEAAGADAASREHGDLPVGRRRSGLQVEVLLEDVHDLVGPLDVAGRAGADDAGVAPLRLEREEVVERRHAVDLRERQAQLR